MQSCVCLFLCGVYLTTDYTSIVSNGKTNDELGRTQKEAVLTKSEILSPNFPGGKDENYEKPQSE
jgi:hypothetical protein